MSTIKITHYSDILCVWAYVSQRRIDELLKHFGDQVEIDFHFFAVFGDAHRKMVTNWQDKGGVKGYHKHVASLAEDFPHLNIHPSLWVDPTPRSSLPGHLYLCAARLLEEQGLIPKGSFRHFLKTVRHSFFCENRDISDTKVLRDIVEKSALPTAQIMDTIENGSAYAALSHDAQLSIGLAVHSSPTLIFNENRQRLTGNVGYKIIEANVKELLEEPIGGQSWC